ncbi:hypothetical protein AAZX31_07G167000 [Glycine max]|uniref:Uncharacterized protein n=2 Tax=Glycine subgen. Soja TaxID=1462606 RepID=A0A0R0J9C4_SOYBN|nr:hypothetical protein JHK85_019537 [Glycine max]RZC03480.1 hypothetical protein D0Y65_018244 [Glycine soja]KAG5038280.1 hypothetical protein JHK86_019120 [Glycine max]KAG5143403.1 hypothetical protein JHK82_019098 [Glycine max]KAH1087405.1 hypothetical protein GYH30_018808 [Glycine max]
MASQSCIILALFIAIFSFSSMDTAFAARHLLQNIPGLPDFSTPPTLPPLTIPNVLCNGSIFTFLPILCPPSSSTSTTIP